MRFSNQIFVAAALLLPSAMAGAQTTAPAADAQAGAAAQADAQTTTQTGAITLATKDDITAGAKVFDQKGGDVGTVESVSDTGAVISTGVARVQIPLNSFGKSDRGLVIAMTKTELEAAAHKGS
ncbi:MAG: hypothetical protein ACM3YM_08765 [Sphingomonadales bacterium]